MWNASISNLLFVDAKRCRPRPELIGSCSSEYLAMAEGGVPDLETDADLDSDQGYQESGFGSVQSSASSVRRSLAEIIDEDIKEYKHTFPEDLKPEYQDAVILYTEADRKRVLQFIANVSQLQLQVGPNRTEKLVVSLYDEVLTAQTRIGELEKVLKYCTFVLLFCTEDFFKDSWTEFSGQACLLNAIEERVWSVVPIWTLPKRTFKSPMLTALKGVSYQDEQNPDFSSIKTLFEGRIQERLKKAEAQTHERILHIIGVKAEDVRRNERREREVQLELKIRRAEKERQAVEMKIREMETMQSLEKQRRELHVRESEAGQALEGWRRAQMQQDMTADPRRVTVREVEEGTEMHRLFQVICGENPPVDIYPMVHDMRGVFLLISNENFARARQGEAGGPEDRTGSGAKVDVISLKKLFDGLHFEVVLKKDLTAEGDGLPDLPDPPDDQLDLEVDSCPEGSDVFLLLSSIPGFKSFRGVLGSWFIQCLVEVFSEHAHEMDLNGLADKLHEKMRDKGFVGEIGELKQQPEFRRTTSKKLYFFPGLYKPLEH
ncbi:hypothetical protein BaRGS_00030437 [Batillaria attramentaria]|uniref:TIR domain-containing protein n=1 Tax=Batillaria attramentaria TaxID=370345 RepID=A0ABD0JUE5_9CAEN